MPCQVQGLHYFLKKEYENLLTVIIMFPKIILDLIRSDYLRYYGGDISSVSLVHIFRTALFSNNFGFKYSFWLRLCSHPNPYYIIAKFFHNRLSVRLGVYIPGSTKIGYGLYIGHPTSIVINEKTIIGNNVNIGQMLSIGSNHGTPAIIGNEVYIGPSVCLVENVHIGDGCIIGAGSVVIHDIPSQSTAVGVPAKVVGPNKHPEYIQNKYIV